LEISLVNAKLTSSVTAAVKTRVTVAAVPVVVSSWPEVAPGLQSLAGSDCT
jgi:hypothetical protein